MEIALAIPASNDEKYNWSNSTGQGLTFEVIEFQFSPGSPQLQVDTN